MPSSLRLEIAPDGHEAAHEGLRQCSQIRGRWNMKVFSKSSLISSETFFRIGSFGVSLGEPPRSSSQLALQLIFIGLPLMSERGCATGVCSCRGELSRVS